jgi:predicted GIY-YIG superfamily endonuclease
VYVIRLDNAVLREPRFAKENPQHDARKPCVYVGMTGLSPEHRFANHKAGNKANRYVERYGVGLIPRLYARYNPMSYEEATAMEKELASRLKKRGYAVWQR